MCIFKCFLSVQTVLAMKRSLSMFICSLRIIENLIMMYIIS